MYQIRFPRNGGCCYTYFHAAPEQAAEAACETANKYLHERANSALTSWTYKPVKTAYVVEYDNETKVAKRKGERFRLRLRFVEAVYVGGRKERGEWYEAEAK